MLYVCTCMYVCMYRCIYNHVLALVHTYWYKTVLTKHSNILNHFISSKYVYVDNLFCARY